jgi:hypothetical protein
MAHHVAVFLENRPHGLERIGLALKEAKINIRALTLADAGDYGVAKLLVANPQKACNVLKDAGLIASLREIIALEMTDLPGGFFEASQKLADAGINILDAYGFIVEKGARAILVVQVEDVAQANARLSGIGMKSISDDDLADL